MAPTRRQLLRLAGMAGGVLALEAFAPGRRRRRSRPRAPTGSPPWRRRRSGRAVVGVPARGRSAAGAAAAQPGVLQGLAGRRAQRGSPGAGHPAARDLAAPLPGAPRCPGRRPAALGLDSLLRRFAGGAGVDLRLRCRRAVRGAQRRQHGLRRGRRLAGVRRGGAGGAPDPGDGPQRLRCGHGRHGHRPAHPPAGGAGGADPGLAAPRRRPGRGGAHATPPPPPPTCRGAAPCCARRWPPGGCASRRPTSTSAAAK